MPERGQIYVGVFSDGGLKKCETVSGRRRCVYVGWPEQWLAYKRPSFDQATFWHGTLLFDKRDEASTFFRRNRYYDPQTARFTQEDPLGLAGGLNLYGFANGDPVNFSDPFGLCHTTVHQEEKKKCKLREPTKEEKKRIEELEKKLAATEDAQCRAAGAEVRQLRTRNQVRFWDQEIRDPGLLRGDVLWNEQNPQQAEQIHVYSGQGSNWTPAFRAIAEGAHTLHEAAHITLGTDEEGPVRELTGRCIGVR
jgi:RHS repeat-associated protein